MLYESCSIQEFCGVSCTQIIFLDGVTFACALVMLAHISATPTTLYLLGIRLIGFRKSG